MNRLSRRPSGGSIALNIYGVLTLLFLSGPLVVVMLMSFSSGSGLGFPPPGWSLQWYEQLFSNPQWIEAVKNSLIIGGASSIIALLLGGLAAYGLARALFPGRGMLLAFFLAPLIIPPIVTAVALFLTFTNYGIRNSILGVIIGHVVIAIPYVVLLLVVAFQSLDQRIEQMARSLGAGWVTSFRVVVLPMLIPSIVATWLIALVVSFDEVIVTIFVAGRQVTVPKLMFSQLRDRIDPTVSALSTILVLVTILIMIVAGVALRSSLNARKSVAGLVAGEAATREMK
jgi:ABC-type spermidine/putrescine transport system permease subunit II